MPRKGVEYVQKGKGVFEPKGSEALFFFVLLRGRRTACIIEIDHFQANFGSLCFLKATASFHFAWKGAAVLFV